MELAVDHIKFVANAVTTTEDSPKGDLTAWEARTVTVPLFGTRVTEDRPGDPTARAFNFQISAQALWPANQ